MLRLLLASSVLLATSIAGAADYELLNDDPSVFAIDQQSKAISKSAWRVGEVVHGFTPQMDWTSSLTPGTCYAILGRAGAGPKKVTLTLFAPDGKRIAQSKPGSSTTLRYCSTWLGSYHVQAKADSAGTYVVATYALSGTPPTTQAPPLVASPTPVAPPPPVYAPAPAPVYVAPPPQTVYVAQPTQTIYVPAPTTTTTIILHDTRGDDCTSSLDCGPGEFCKDDGAGFKMCMGNNARGMACQSSIDCGSGLFCREDDSGFKSCR